MTNLKITQTSSAKSRITEIGNTTVSSTIKNEGLIDAVGKAIKGILSGIVLPLIIIAVILIVGILFYKEVINKK